MRKVGKAKWKPCPVRIRKWNLRRRYKMSPEEYDSLLASQNGLCAICHKPKSDNKQSTLLYVDHHHGKNVVRGLLCHHCNSGLGAFRDSIDLLKRAIKYLKRKLT